MPGCVGLSVGVADGDGVDGNADGDNVLGSKVGIAVQRPGYSVHDLGEGVGSSVTRPGEYGAMGAGGGVSKSVFRVGFRVSCRVGEALGADVTSRMVGARVGRRKPANAGGNVPRTSIWLVASFQFVPKNCNLKPDFCTEPSDRKFTRIVSDPTESVSGMTRPVIEATTRPEVE